MGLHEKNIVLLNKAVADELHAIHQYMYFHFHCDDQGYDLLANLFKKTAIEEMVHLEKLSERILFLKGDVIMKPAGEVEQIRDVKAMLEKARAMERQSFLDYNAWANECTTNADAVSRQLFESLVASEELHYNQFDQEIINIESFGDNYLALQSIERSRKSGK